tara:strand:- start:1568 stop:1729 length:162 start_codon:yes stop_codon:yes gene_type:complete
MNFNTDEWDLISDLLENRKYQLEEREESTEERHIKAELHLINSVKEKMTRSRN